MERPAAKWLLWISLFTVLLTAMSCQVLSGAEGRPHVLLLHSYDKGDWTDELTRGYFSVFNRRAPCDLHIEYMDTKKNQSAEYFGQLEKLYALKYKGVRFAVVLVSDDNAFRFALDRQEILFKGAPVVFCGVNDFKPEMLKDHPNATGVVERLDLEETMAVAMRLRPGTKLIRVITDETETAKTNLAGLQGLLAKRYPGINVELLEQISLEELRKQLSVKRDDAIGYFNAFWKDEKERPVTPHALGEVFRQSAIPIFGRSEWMIGRGMVGGKCVTGFHQGEAAAALAARILDGTPASQIPVILDSPNKFLFNHPELEKFGFPVSDLPSENIILNRPHSFYEDHEMLVWSTAAVIAALSILSVLLARNIIRRKRIEAELRAEQAKLKIVHDQTFQLMGTLDLDGRLLNANRAALNLVGAAEADVCGKFFWETRWWTHSKELQERIRQAVQDAREGQTVRFLTTIADVAGRLHHIDFSLKPAVDAAGRTCALIPEGRDITEAQEALQKLRESEERFRSVVQSAPMGIHLYRLENDGRLIFTGANPAADIILNINHAQFVGKAIEEAFPGLRATEVPQRYRQACAEGTPWQTDQLIYEDDRIKGAFDVHAFQIAPGAMAVMFLDITHRKQTEMALRESERRYRSTFEQAPVGIASVSMSGRLLRANQRLCDILGRSHTELLNATSDELIHADDVARDHRQRDELRGGTQNSCSSEICLRRKDGTIVPVNRTISLLRDDNGRPQYFVEVVEDVTERKMLAERLRHSQKMEAIGQLAGGVAHDFNNQLTAIIGYAELFGAANVDERLKKYAENVVESARKSASLTRQLLAFARKGNYESVTLDIHDLVDQVIDMLKRSIDKRITIRRDLKARPSHVTGDPAMLQNAILNLAINARDAMPEGGTVTFETALVEAGDGGESPPDLPCGRYVCLRVRDTGVGMSKAILERIFEPFFTTKAPGKGTGLGLPAVYGTVQQHQGALTVSSEPGRGSCFSIFLPPAEEPEKAPANTATPEHAAGRGRILVVDDEQLVRELTRSLLEEQGHTVAVVPDGASGVEYYRNNWREIDLVVLDLIMPKMDGRTALKAIRSINSDARVLLVSGYSTDANGLILPEDNSIAFLQKPFNLSDLQEGVARLLTGS